MHNSPSLVSLCLIGALQSVVACGGNTGQTANTGGAAGIIPSGTGPVTVDQLPHEMAIAECNLLLRCAGAASVEYGNTSAQCLSDFEKRVADQSVPQLSAAIAAGSTTYDPAAARACLDTYAQLNCDYSNEQALVTACDNAWKGSVAIGGACNSSFECVGNTGDTFCASSGTCPGHCQSRGALGQTCTGDDECALGAECDTSTEVCKNRLKLGESCGTSTTATGVCGGFSICAQDSSGSYKCENLFDNGTASEGQICDATNACVSGLYCEATSEQSDAASMGPVMRCQKASSSGGTCRYATRNPCPDGQFCPASYSQAFTISAQCTAQVAPGQSCVGSYVNECQSDAHCTADHVCVAIQRIGGACASVSDCYSNVCTNGLCVAPSDCSR